MNDDLDLTAIGNRLYPNAAADRSTRNARPATPDETQRALELLYPPRPAETLEPGEYIYGMATALRDTFDRNLKKLGDADVVSDEEQADERSEFAQVIRDAGLDPTLGRLLHDRWTQAKIAAARQADDASAAAAVDAEIRATAEATRTAVRDRWGRKAGADLLLRVQKLAQQHPQLDEILHTRSIGMNLDVVTALIEHVNRTNFR